MPAVKTASDNGEFLCTRFQEAFQMLGKKMEWDDY